MNLSLEDEQFRAVAGPMLERAAGLIAAQLARAAEAMAADREAGLMEKAAAMDYLAIKSERTLEAWMKPEPGGRGLPHVKIGETVRFRRSSIDRWLTGQEVNRRMEDAA